MCGCRQLAGIVRLSGIHLRLRVVLWHVARKCRSSVQGISFKWLRVCSVLCQAILPKLAIGVTRGLNSILLTAVDSKIRRCRGWPPTAQTLFPPCSFLFVRPSRNLSALGEASLVKLDSPGKSISEGRSVGLRFL